MKNIISFSLFTSLFGCFKQEPKFKQPTQYPEDPRPSTISATERLINKDWVLTSATVNGVEMIDSVTKKTGYCSFKLTSESIKYYGGDYNVFKGILLSDTSGSNKLLWSLTPDESQIWREDYIVFGSSGSYASLTYPNFSIIPQVYEQINSFSWVTNNTSIRKLTSNEFKVSITNTTGDSTFVNYYQAL